MWLMILKTVLAKVAESEVSARCRISKSNNKESEDRVGIFYPTLQVQ